MSHPVVRLSVVGVIEVMALVGAKKQAVGPINRSGLVPRGGFTIEER